ncbi:MAG: class A beta-lactamase-related serine hydrolase, partial [Myxococcales bacterium]
ERHLGPVPRQPPGRVVGRLTRDGAEVTLDHLLHHTSGLPDIDLEVEVTRARWRRSLSVADQIAVARAHPLRSRPGTVFRYSNLNYDLLGEVVRRVSGRSLDDYLRERLLAPLGMGHTSYADPPGGPEVQARGSFRVLGRRFDAASGFGLDALPLDESHASGGLRTTTHDLLRWTALYEGHGPLPAPWSAVMVKPGLDRYGAGVVAVDTDGWAGVWHNGALSPLGFASELAYFPGRRAAVIVLGNVDVTEGGAPARLRANLVRRLQGREPARPAEAPRLPALLSAPLGVFLYASLGPWRHVIFAALVVQQGHLLGRRRDSRAEVLATAINAWPLLILLFTLADLPAPARWLGWLGAALLVGYSASRVAPLPWYHREPRRQHGALLSPA